MASPDVFSYTRGRGAPPGRGRPLSRNKQWVGNGPGPTTSTGHSDGERGGHYGRGRGRGAPRGAPRKFPNVSLRNTPALTSPIKPPPRTHNVEETHVTEYKDEPLPEIHEPLLETQEEREKLYQELVAAREQERKQAIADGKMDDPLVPKRLEDAITIVGTCPDMCPRFERYRRERENNLFEWETIPRTKRVDHQRAVKMYERAAGDKTLPSDLRPPHVLKKTLDYLFHDLLHRGGLRKTANFIRDRSRAVRNDFTMQHLTGPMAIECHDRCARFHLLTMHFERTNPGFSLPLEEQQVMNTLQSLKEFYEDQRGKYQSPTELEMRVYHRLIHIRDQRERHENIPDHILHHPVFQFVTQFRLHVQKKSAPITKISSLVVDAEGMEIFAQLVANLREQGNTVMIYLVACILERLFGPETIDDIEAIRGDLSLSDVIDGNSGTSDSHEQYEGEDEDFIQDVEQEQESEAEPQQEQERYLPPSSTSQPANVFAISHPTVSPQKSAFSALISTPNVFGTPPFSATSTPSVFGGPFGATQSNTVSPSPINQSQSSTARPLAAPPPANHFASQTANTESQSNGHAPVRVVAPLSTQTNGNSMPQPAPSIPKLAPETNGFSMQPPPSLNPHAPLFTHSIPSTSLTLPPQRKPSLPSMPQPQGVASTSVTPSAATPAPLISRMNRSNSSSSSRGSGTPPPLKIDIAFPPAPAVSPAAPSPREPPPLPRQVPLSLPSTPTLNIPPPSALLNHIKGNLASPFRSSPPGSSGPLSPLAMQSPSASPFPSATLNNFSLQQPPMSKGNQLALGLLKLNGKSKDKAPDRLPIGTKVSTEALARMEENALTFARTGSVVKQCFRQWLEKVIARAAYLEACRQGEMYREKMKLQQSQSRDGSGSGNGTPDKKRRISIAPTPAESPQRKRARKRLSSTYQAPRTDDELAQRFKEKHEDHERRWAVGSFLHTFQSHIKRQVHLEDTPSLWQLWVSVNPEADATAIWVEKKFDIPNSGEWASEAVYSIPISRESRQQKPDAHPGVIIFECTPVEGVHDDIERKYRILDDCTRLREIVNGLPSGRFYNPSLLTLCWTRDSESYSAPDFFDMVDKFVREGPLKSHAVVLMNSNDFNPDEKLSAALNQLSLDVEGERVRSLTIQGISKPLISVLKPFIAEWVASCTNGEYFNWKLYNLVVHAGISLLNDLIVRVASLSKKSDSGMFILPGLEDNLMDDSDSAYKTAEEWLSDFPPQKDVSHILIDLESHRNIEQDFPSQIFLDHIVQLSEELLQASSHRTQTYLVLNEDLSVAEFEESLQAWRVRLSQRLNTTSRRSPKRRSGSVGTSEASFFNPESKRVRLSTPSITGESTPISSPMLNGHPYGLQPSPSPTQSLASLPVSETPQPVVTAAMLRALTKDLKKKYIRHP